MNELELKFQVAEADWEPLRIAFVEAGADEVRLEARYFDTVDGLLSRHGIALRIRREGDMWVQTLKVPSGNSAVDRLEHNAVIRGSDRTQTPLDIERHEGQPAYERLMRVLQRAHKRGEAVILAEVYRTDVNRQKFDIATGTSRIEMALDIGTITAAGRSRDVHELEFELKKGTAAELFQAAEPWIDRYCLCIDIVSKSERGQLLARGLTHGEPTRAIAPRRVSPRRSCFVQDAVAACLDQVLRNASELAAGSGNADHVHQMRVGLRRLRTALRELEEFNTHLKPDWEPTLAAAFRELGRHRDHTLISSKTASDLASAGAPPVGLAPPASELQSPADIVRATPLQRTLLELLAFTAQEDGAEDLVSDGDALKTVIERLDRHHQKTRKSGKRFTAMKAPEQHSVRKRLKRLRYLAEFIAPAFQRSKVESYFADLKPAQDALGEHNDEATAVLHFRKQAEQEPQAWFAVGWLTARQRASAQTASKALKKAGQAQPFWARKYIRTKALQTAEG